MNRTLDILVPHFNESENECEFLLNSIALQQSINFKEIGVIICNDGDEKDGAVILSKKFLKKGPFKVEYYICEHRGVSATRNECLEKSKADYVSFCDIDDGFFHMCGLGMVFNEIRIGFEMLISLFVEETKDQNGNLMYINREMDSTFVHGKFFKRQFLIDKNIKWNPDLKIHEDSYFNVIAQNCTTELKYLNLAFYLWKWRDNSVCRHDPYYMLKTYVNFIDSSDAIASNFIQRGMLDRAQTYICSEIGDAYFTMNKREWIEVNNKEYRDNTERRFAEYYKKYKEFGDSMPMQDRIVLSSNIRERIIREGMMIESTTVTQWLDHLINDYN